MKVYVHETRELDGVRAHPWTTGLTDEKHIYYDFKLQPELIPKVLEDFVPFNKWQAIRKFHDLLRWLNGDSSVFESNDCGFHGPKQNINQQFVKKMQCEGRLMFLFRDLTRNLSQETYRKLEKDILLFLDRKDPAFEWGVVGTSIMPVYYLELPLPENDCYGCQMMLSFWAWGDNEKETMRNLERVVKSLFECLTFLSKRYR